MIAFLIACQFLAYFSLGSGEQQLPDEVRQSVKIREGWIDSCRRNEVGTEHIYEVISLGLDKFVNNLNNKGVVIDLHDHIAKILANKQLFDPPLNKLAREVREFPRFSN